MNHRISMAQNGRKKKECTDYGSFYFKELNISLAS